VGLRRGIGVRSLNALAQAVITHNRNYRNLFYAEPPAGLVPTRREKPLAATAALGESSSLREVSG